jgi:hypothetical protein
MTANNMLTAVARSLGSLAGSSRMYYVNFSNPCKQQSWYGDLPLGRTATAADTDDPN